MQFFKNQKQVSIKWLVLIQWVLAYEWLQSGWAKFAKPDFMNGIATTLATFAQKSKFEFYRNFLNSAAVPNPQVFGNIVRFSEILIGLGLAIGGYVVISRKQPSKVIVGGLVIALFGGAFLNLNLYLAASFSSPSTAGINMVMGLTQAILGTFYLRNLKKLSGN